MVLLQALKWFYLLHSANLSLEFDYCGSIKIRFSGERSSRVSLRSLPVNCSRDTFAKCIPVRILPPLHHITVVSKLWGCFLKGRSFFLLEWLSYKSSVVLGREDDVCASKRTWGLLQKSVTIIKSIDEVNLMGKLCTWKVLSKISFWKQFPAFTEAKSGSTWTHWTESGCLILLLLWGGAGDSGSVLIQQWL